MININKPFLTVLLWIGLPLTILLFGHVLGIMNYGDNASMLLLLYITFSWSIAVLIFVVETIRHQIFKPLNPVKGGIRLAIYALVTAVLSLLTSPSQEILSLNSFLITSIMFFYGAVAGFVYQQYFRAS